MDQVLAALTFSLLSLAMVPRLDRLWRLHFAVSLPLYTIYFLFVFKPSLIGVQGLVLLSALLLWWVYRRPSLEASLVALGVYVLHVIANYLTGIHLVLSRGEALSDQLPYYLTGFDKWLIYWIYAALLLFAYRLLSNSMRKKIGSFKNAHLMLIFADGAIVLLALCFANYLYRFYVRSMVGIDLVPGLSELLSLGLHASVLTLTFLIYLLNSYWVTHFNFKAFQSVADLDSLTGVLNRASGLKRIQEVHRHARAINGDFVLCFVDVNNLKGVNDKYGHKEGDIMIQMVSEALSKPLRDGDFVCRYGGDEFILCFNNCTLEAGERAWRRIGQEVDSLAFKLDKPYRISVSHGLVAFSDHRRVNVKTLIEKADQLMYQQKYRMKGLYQETSAPDHSRIV